MPTKPTVTNDHLKKYQEIMGTTVAPKTPALHAETSETHKPESKWTKSSFLSVLPKPSDLSNKMFIFTGKKKIIIAGDEKQVENVKTVDTGKEKEISRKTVEKTPTPPPPKEAPIPAKVPTTVSVSREKVKEEKKLSVPGQNKKIPMPYLITSFALFLGVWTLFWLVFFGYIQL